MKNEMSHFASGYPATKPNSLKKDAIFSLKFYIIYWIVIIKRGVTSLKECIVLSSLWKLYLHVNCQVYQYFSEQYVLSIFKFYVDLLQKICLSMMVAPLGVFYSKLRVIKCYYSILYFQKNYSASIFDFGNLLIVLNL